MWLLIAFTFVYYEAVIFAPGCLPHCPHWKSPPGSHLSAFQTSLEKNLSSPPSPHPSPGPSLSTAMSQDFKELATAESVPLRAFYHPHHYLRVLNFAVSCWQIVKDPISCSGSITILSTGSPSRNSCKVWQGREETLLADNKSVERDQFTQKAVMADVPSQATSLPSGREVQGCFASMWKLFITSGMRSRIPTPGPRRRNENF